MSPRAISLATEAMPVEEETAALRVEAASTANTRDIIEEQDKNEDEQNAG
jgi:DNA-dependent RNA polymerase auxiliary subunit epsilon